MLFRRKHANTDVSNVRSGVYYVNSYVSSSRRTPEISAARKQRPCTNLLKNLPQTSRFIAQKCHCVIRISTFVTEERLNTPIATTAAELEQPPTTSPSLNTAMSTRVLACKRCHQRKLKCDRKFPCKSCVTAGSDCVSNPLTPRQRRRRFAERELLDRIQLYEGLLRQNNIPFKPLHADSIQVTTSSQEPQSPSPSGDALSRDENPSVISPITEGSSTLIGALNLWKCIYQQSHGASSSDTTLRSDRPTLADEKMIHEAMDRLSHDNNSLLLLAPSMNLDMSSLRPPHAHVFSLWQIYLENVNPLLKVTHTPTLQARITNAVNNPGNVENTLEALMFSIYCVALLSLTEAECLETFHVARAQLLTQYQFSCREALLRCKFLHSKSRDCLTALYLYLISVKPYTDRRSLCAILGTAVRIAQQIGIHSESTNLKCLPFEAEMRRRLWWSFVVFDARVCEGSHNLSSSTMVPTWDCKAPSNINDFEIWPEMKTPPVTHEYPTEAIFVMVQSTVIQHMRHSNFMLDFINPTLKAIKTSASETLPAEGYNDLGSLRHALEGKCLSGYNPEDPIHFAAQWTGESQTNKARLWRHYWSDSKQPEKQDDELRDVAMIDALEIIRCEAQLSSSPLVKCFRWYFTHFPFPAYAHILQDLKKRPSQEFAGMAWRDMNRDFLNRLGDDQIGDHPIFVLFANSVIDAWKAREAVLKEDCEEQPWFVQEMMQISRPGSSSNSESRVLPLGDVMLNVDLDEFLPVLNDFSEGYLLLNPMG